MITCCGYSASDSTSDESKRSSDVLMGLVAGLLTTPLGYFTSDSISDECLDPSDSKPRRREISCVSVKFLVLEDI